MNLTDKRFWIVWAVAELLLLASCVDAAIRCRSFAIVWVFAVSQPLMVTLAFLKYSHRDGAMVNLFTVSAYTILSIFLRLTDEDSNGWGWLFFTMVVPLAQFVIVLLYWGLAWLAGAAGRNSAGRH